MKQLLFSVCLSITVILVSAQSQGNGFGYNPNKNIRMDVNYNQYLNQCAFAWKNAGKAQYENYVLFKNYTDDVLSVQLRIPAFGIDTVYSVPPTGDDYVMFYLGDGIIPFEGELINPFMVECVVNQSGYDFTLRYISYRGVKKYFK
jgi:hypothetical protein